MSTNVLVTGRPGCGKTTLIRRVAARLGGLPGGFFTEEIRVGGVRRGFKVVTFEGEEGILAHVDLPGPPCVGKYGVDLAALEAVGVASIRRALVGSRLVVIDEIGPMEMLSPAFCRVVIEALEAENTVFGSVVWRSRPFSDRVKARPDVELIEVQPANRDALVSVLAARLGAR